MPRNGSGTYQRPQGTTAEANQTITSAMWEAQMGDLAQDLNTTRPITSGGTGGTTTASARAALELVKQTADNDATAGSLLLTGAFGLGTTDGVSVPGGDCDLITRFGLYQGVSGTTLHMPSAGNWAILHIPRTTTRAMQIAARTSVGDVSYRINADGVWTGWAQVYGLTENSSNVNGSFQRTTDGTLVCRNAAGFTSAISTPFFGGFRSATQTWTFPTAYTNPPRVKVIPTAASAFGSVLISTTTTHVTYAVLSVASATSDARTVNLYAEGA